MTIRSEALALLRQLLANKDAEFRHGQWEAIDALVSRREQVLLVQRTGWGKSAVYFIATRMLRERGFGATLIVSPLLALMRNQVSAAERMGVRALTINSTNRSEWPALRRAALSDEADALLVSPERLANESFMDEVLLPISERIGLLVVDEAHCISDWGHDFRPDYRRLANVLRRMPANMPVVGTTATANDRVIDDVTSQLGRIEVQRGPLMRETLQLQTLRLPTQAERLAWLAEHIDELPGTGIIYTLTARDAEQVSAWLNARDVFVRPYHASVEHECWPDSNTYRRRLEQALDRNEVKALVATTALGMGYDKPDLGFVVHYQAPGSIIAYYQQVGRAGRGIARSVGVMLSGFEDGEIHDYFRRTAFPDERWVRSVLGALEEKEDMSTRDLEQALNLRRSQIEKVLKVLSVENPAPINKEGSRWRRTPVSYRVDAERVARLTAQRELEWREVESYIDEQGCLMEFLAQALDDPDPKPCGKCARCLGGPVVDTSVPRETVAAAARFLRRAELPLKCRKQVAKGSFPAYGWSGNLPPELRAEQGRILSRWGDAGWGEVVARDKLGGRFRDELVEAAGDMIKERWHPHPWPDWVTCVPSNRHPTLVPDFAARLASALSLPYATAVAKVEDNAPQKEQQNRFHQCNNLDGVFAIEGQVRKGAVLLVDDVVDSRWTLTVIAALLRQAGCAAVWPFALATAAPGD
ncbi:MAG: RecQ family ATP-dependent DNA helicase [Gammaproteobacteria bacterium]|nr:RecQ family ATP-dependent DNA helicase [Gammaproteobacteria bacterium]